MKRSQRTASPKKIAQDMYAKRSDSYLKRGMYTSITIEGFRQFSHLKLENLGKVNLLFGANNSGKTSILEAIFTHACGLNFVPFTQIISRRQDNASSGPLDYAEKVISVFNDKEPPYTFSISARVDSDTKTHKLTESFIPSSVVSDLDPRSIGQFSRKGHTDFTDPITDAFKTHGSQSTNKVGQLSSLSIGKWLSDFGGEDEQELDLRFPPVGLTPVPPFKYGHLDDILSHRAAGADLKIFSSLKRSGILEEFTTELKSSFPQIKGLDTIPYPDGTPGPVYVTNTQNQILPLYTFGDGMRRWFHILGNMIVYQNGCHCIEEVDSTFHPEAQPQFARCIVDYAEKFQNQVFLTSHSIEFADNFLEALYGENGTIKSLGLDPVRVFTLKATDVFGEPELWALSGNEAYQKRRDYQLELR